ncbi:hypothetical protein JYU34_013988 [Plutella xylostella]|uniref:Uncharacterized protein n=1 Tax=Plutella xylostella TaxID=51655 RepID=A0ABQ7Q7D0_PLUXY|nr:hypothetical protein JYU34_013988 [Plutella xylostella]
MSSHWSWMSGAETAGAGDYIYSPPSRPSRPPHRPLVKLANNAHLHVFSSPYK